MKPYYFSFVVVILSLLTACSSAATQDFVSGADASLLVTGGEVSEVYTRADLEALPVAEAVFNDVNYRGVTASALLKDAGFNLDEVRAVKALASDGYSINYDPAQVLAAEVIVAYARVDGDLVEEDGAFRIVMPGAEGKLNVRMLIELQVIK